MANTFGGSAYAWMWFAKSAEKWAEETIEGIRSGKIVNDVDNVDEW